MGHDMTFADKKLISSFSRMPFTAKKKKNLLVTIGSTRVYSKTNCFNKLRKTCRL